MLVRPSVCPSVISRFSIKNGQTIIIQTTQIANVVVRCKRSWWNYPKWGEVGKICDIQQITHMSEMTQDSDMCIIQRVHKTPPLSIMVKSMKFLQQNLVHCVQKFVEIWLHVFKITRPKHKTQVSVTTQTHGRSQLSPMKQCDYSAIVVTFFLTNKLKLLRVFGAFERCSRVRLYLRRKWTDLDEIWGTPSILFKAGPDRFWARSAQKRERETETLRKFCFYSVR